MGGGNSPSCGKPTLFRNITRNSSQGSSPPRARPFMRKPDMAEAIFQTSPVSLQELLKSSQVGKIQLPDFQRSWVWDEDRIKSLIASISRAFPVGALMTLKTGGPVNFKARPIEGASDGIKPEHAEALLLDGQQRMTSMYQVALRDKVVRTM